MLLFSSRTHDQVRTIQFPIRYSSIILLNVRDCWSNDAKKKILISFCKTRWSERNNAYQYFHNAFPYIIDVLEVIDGIHPDISKYAGWDTQSKRDFSFIVG